MINRRRGLRSNSSGQLLLVAALAIALLISSTTMYVYEMSKETDGESNGLVTDFVLALKHTTRNALISSLANVSSGGPRTTLTENLEELSRIYKSLSRFGLCDLSYTPQNDSKYDSGTWLAWNATGLAMSSVYANFTLRVYGFATNITAVYAFNVTTTAQIQGSYILLDKIQYVTLKAEIWNEGEPAMAQNITLFYSDLGNWREVAESDYLATLNYGNGTYAFFFAISVPSESVQISAHIHDARGIYVQANTTCYAA